MDIAEVSLLTVTVIFTAVSIIAVVLAGVAYTNSLPDSSSSSNSTSSSSSPIIDAPLSSVNYLLPGYGEARQIPNSGVRLITKSMSGTNPLSFYNGGGLGNKAMLSLDYPGLVSDFRTLSFTVRKPYDVVINFYVNILVKIDFSVDTWTNNDVILVLENPIVDLNLTQNFQTFTFSYDQAIWVSVGGKGGLPPFLPPTVGAPLTTLTDYNIATFFNAVCLDGGFPKQNTHAGAFNIVIGDSVNTSYMVVDIQNVQIDNTLYNFK
jgi:hypothetical protein